MFDSLNVGKLGVTLNLKHPEGTAIARKLIGLADAVAENFAPKAMRGFGLDYASLSADKPSLVMVSSCLQGQTGPHRDYPGFGGQGSALGGYNILTGWPDREPIGPFGTITDSLAPRFVRDRARSRSPLQPPHRQGRVPRRQPGRGRRLQPVAVDRRLHGERAHRHPPGNGSQRFSPHGVFVLQRRRPLRGDRMFRRPGLAEAGRRGRDRRAATQVRSAHMPIARSRTT